MAHSRLENHYFLNGGFIDGDQIIADLGAHIGLVSLPVSRHLAAGGKVYAFEPSGSNRRLLERHLALNRADNVEIVDALVGERDADAVVFYEAEGDNPMNTIAQNTDRPGFAATTKRQVSVDSFCQARGLAPDIVKIDVEGAEIGVLEGARGLINGVTCGAGMPYKVAELAAQFGINYYPIVSSSRAFRALWKRAYHRFAELLGGVVYEDPVAGRRTQRTFQQRRPRQARRPLPAGQGTARHDARIRSRANADHYGRGGLVSSRMGTLDR